MENYKIKSILFPTDFSESGKSALDTACAICKRQKAKLTIVNVTDIDSTGKEKLIADITNKNYKKLKTVAEKIYKDYNLDINIIAEKGKASEVICNIAAGGNYSLIVIGTHGVSGLAGKLGSTVYKVVKNAPCPVLSIRGDWNYHDFKKIVYPIRYDQKVFEKYNYIAPIIKKNKSELIITLLTDKNNPEQIPKAIFSLDLLRSMCEEERIVHTTVVLPCANYPAKIFETADYYKADLIVISSNLNYDSGKKNIIEPFAQSILNHSKYPVLCINPVLDNPLDVSKFDFTAPLRKKEK